MSTEKKHNPEPSEEKDTEGHDIFATQDYYFQRSRERDAQIEREMRERERVKEARKAKQGRR